MFNAEVANALSKLGATGLIAGLAFFLISVGDKQLAGNKGELVAYIMSQQKIIETCVGVDTGLPTVDEVMLRTELNE